MKPVRIIAVLAWAATSVPAQPVIQAGSVTNAASYIPDGLPSSGVAQGSIFILKGRNLGACGVTQSGLPRPTSLGGTSIRVAVGGQTRNALMVYVVACQEGGRPDQLAAILPSDTPAGTGTVSVTYNGQTVTAPIRVVRNALGLFTVNQAGSGPAVVTDASENWPILATSSAQPGQLVTFWGTGLSAVSFADDQGAPFQDLTSVNLQLFIGGKPATVLFRGRSPGSTGLDQINAEIPAGVEGCFVPVVAVVNGVASNFTTIAVSASGGECSDALGYTAADLATAQSAGGLRVGSIVLARTKLKFAFPGTGSIDSTTDIGSASFEKFSLTQIYGSQGFGFVSEGACTVGYTSGDDTTPDDPVKGEGLDAGASITVRGPAGEKQMNRMAVKGVYSGQLGGGTPNPFGGGAAAPAFLEPGAYTVSGAGGADVGAFSANFRLPSPLTWANQASITTVNRSQGVNVTWTGGDPAGFTFIFGYSGVGSGQNPVSAVFSCIVKTSLGNFTVPSSVLLALPATPAGEQSFGVLGVGSSSQPVRFTAPGLDLGFLAGTSLNGSTVTYQ